MIIKLLAGLYFPSDCEYGIKRKSECDSKKWTVMVGHEFQPEEEKQS